MTAVEELTVGPFKNINELEGTMPDKKRTGNMPDISIVIQEIEKARKTNPYQMSEILSEKRGDQ